VRLSQFRTAGDAELPHATKKDMAFHLRRLESLLTVTPQRMRMIVDSFIDTLERGLQHDKQMVVRQRCCTRGTHAAAHVPDLRAP